MRPLIQFDLASVIPAGATITAAELSVNCDRTRTGGNTVDVHRLTSEWGEGTSVSVGGGGGGGGGGPTTGDDANWISRRFSMGLNWTTPGGDYVPTASTTQTIFGFGAWTFPSSPATVADAQDWLDNPQDNFGWILIGDEPTGNGNAKRLISREGGSNGPRLRVTFSATAAMWGTYGNPCDTLGTPPPTLGVSPNVGSGQPRIGTPFRLEITQGATAMTASALFLSPNAAIPPIVLPAPFACELHVNPTIWSGSTDANLGITLNAPSSYNLVGLELFWQGFGVATPVPARRHQRREHDLWSLMNPSILSLTVALAILANAQAQTTITLSPVSDNTIWETDAACCSNGAGTHAFVGTNGVMVAMRYLLRFDIAGALPPGSTILSAQLDINCLLANSGPAVTNVHRLTASWGEGDSFAGGGQGSGAPSSGDDANWFTRNLATGPNWTTPGGDYIATSSSSTTIDGFGPYQFLSTSMMVADVQTWLDSPSENHGWILIGEEPTDIGTGKRLASREFGSGGPRLEITFSYVGPFAAPFGPPCDKADATPPTLQLDAGVGTGLPTLGQSMRLQFVAGGTTTNGTALFLATTQLTPWSELPAPLACSLHVDNILWTGANDAQDGRTLSLPNNPSLAGLELFWQMFGVTQPFRLVSTNGLLTHLGV